MIFFVVDRMDEKNR
jgi:hypothetical protein